MITCVVATKFKWDNEDEKPNTISMSPHTSEYPHSELGLQKLMASLMDK